MNPLSPNNIPNALVFPLLLSITLPFFLVADLIPWISTPPMAILLYVILFSWIYFAAANTYNLHYDKEFLHLTSIGKSTKVPLSSIKKIQRSDGGIKVQGLTSWRYTIEFYSDVKIADQSIYEVNGGRKVEEFVNIVKQKNFTIFIRLS